MDPVLFVIVIILVATGCLIWQWWLNRHNSTW